MLILEWLGREGHIILSWWLLATLAGVAVMPLCVRFLSGLPDRGYTIARSVGILLVTFVFWILASLGFLPNNTASMVFVWLLVFGISLFAYFGMRSQFSWQAYWRENHKVMIFAEVLFVVLLVVWAGFRAFQNDTYSTEKPMDLMFISSIMRSPIFPPNDAWMSGYSISYYHFGYIMSAMFGNLSGVNSTTTLSMTVAMWAALTGLGAFGVVYNMVRARDYHQEELQEPSKPKYKALWAGVLGCVFIVFLGNFQLPLVEYPYQQGIGNADYYNFWATQARFGDPLPPNPDGSLRPVEEWADVWWWFRASRVLTDIQLAGGEAGGAQPIDEFPNFSFLLGDTHPHVLALPFGMMALALALNVLLTKRHPTVYDLVFYGITIGSFIFLNTWDILAYFGAFIGADALRRIMRNDSGRLSSVDFVSLLGDFVVFAGVAVLSYSIFLYSFRNQAAGILPNILYPTYFPNFFIMFAPFLVLLMIFLLVEVWRGRQALRMNWAWGGTVIAVVTLIIVVFSGLVALRVSTDVNAMNSFNAQVQGVQNVTQALLERRITHSLVAILMAFGMVIVIARLFPRLSDKTRDLNITYSASSGFALLLVAIGAVLVFVPEFFYLADVFGTRINTIFKFYYQVWAVWGIASAFATFSILTDTTVLRPAPILRYTVGGVLGVVLFLGLMYPILGMYSRAWVEPSDRRIAINYGTLDTTVIVQDGQWVQQGDVLKNSEPQMLANQTGQVRFFRGRLMVMPTLTMDGGRYMISANDYQMVQCLDSAVTNIQDIVVVEGVRDAYNSAYGRVGSITGIPILLGWENHQRQWRGSTYSDVAQSRPIDVERLYNDLRWDVALEIIQRYGIDYIVWGDTERYQYELTGEQKFVDNLVPMCVFGDSKIYRVTPDIATDRPGAIR
jgi:YYY domain-containing protein